MRDQPACATDWRPARLQGSSIDSIARGGLDLEHAGKCTAPPTVTSVDPVWRSLRTARKPGRAVPCDQCRAGKRLRVTDECRLARRGGVTTLLCRVAWPRAPARAE